MAKYKVNDRVRVNKGGFATLGEENLGIIVEVSYDSPVLYEIDIDEADNSDTWPFFEHEILGYE